MLARYRSNAGNAAEWGRISVGRITPEGNMKAPFLIGRLIFGGYFIYNGINHFKQTETIAQYAGAKKVPRPREAVMATGAMMLLGGASILLGIKPKYGAAAILGFLAGLSPIMHDFWRAEDPNQRMNDLITFTKNLALMGGAAALIAVEEPWPLSVPVALSRRTERAGQCFRPEISTEVTRRRAGSPCRP